MASNLKSTLFPFLLIFISFPVNVRSIGVNWGTTASHPLPPAKAVELLKANNISKVKLFDANPLVLDALAGSNIDVTVGIPNSMLRSLNSSRKAAESWVHNNLTRYFSEGSRGVKIEYVAVGDDSFLQMYGDQYYPYAVRAAINIQAAITKANLASKVTVVIPCSSDAFLSESNLPSKGHFRSDINQTMTQLLRFLATHRSPFFVTILPFLSFHEKRNTSLEFALFKETARPHNDSRRSYKNSFDLIYGTLVAALSAAGFGRTEIIVGKIGWPTDGAVNATSATAEEFVKGLTEHVRGKPSSTKALPKEIYIFALLDEDSRNTSFSGGFERHWGIFTFDGQAKFRSGDFGQGLKKLVNAENVAYLSNKWCVINNNKNLLNASKSGIEVCSNADCSALSPGGSCFDVSYPGNVSYAFNSYYQMHDQTEGSCDFGGLGLITTVDPSVGRCRFLVQLKTSLSGRVCGSGLLVQLSLPLILLCILTLRW